VHELMAHGLVHEGARTVSGATIGENCRDTAATDRDVIRTVDDALLPDAGFLVLRGNLFDCAIMKTSVISPAFRERYLADPAHPNVLEGRAVVFDGPEDYHARIDDPELKVDEHCLLFLRGAGPLGYPGSAEVVNMQPPAELIRRGVTALPCIGDGRQSGTSGSPSILNASPEAAAGGGLALLRTGDPVRIDLGAGTADVLVPEAELAQRRRELEAAGGYPSPPSQTPWQEIQRGMVDQLADGMVLRPAVAYQRVARNGLPRDNH
jgi:dihydroxy-acid dehydratase